LSTAPTDNDNWLQRTILIYPSTESIEEFKIERSSYGAESAACPRDHQPSLIPVRTTSTAASTIPVNDKLNAYDTFLKAGCPTCAEKQFRATITEHHRRSGEEGQDLLLLVARVE